MSKLLGWLTPARSRMPDQRVGIERKNVGLAGLLSLGERRSSQPVSANYASLARHGFLDNPVVHRCVRLISENAASLPLLIYVGEKELDQHPVLDLLRRPNMHQAGCEFLEAMFGHLLVAGNAYVEKSEISDSLTELHLLRPDRVRVLTGKDGWVRGFEYSASGRKRELVFDRLGRSPVLHLKLFHPLDDHYGAPPLQSALQALQVHGAATSWNRALLENSARPSGALVYAPGEGGNLSEEQFNRLKDELEDGYSGALRAGRPLLLEGGLDWKAMGYSPRDMDFVDGRNAAARDIALAFGVPPMLLGIPGDNTYSNYQEANRALTRQTILPLTRRVLDSLSGWMSAENGEEVRLAIDEDRVDGLSDERETIWKRLNEATFLSENEKRIAAGYSPTEAPV